MFKCSARRGKSRQKPSEMPESCLPTRPKSVRAEAKADKNRAKCLNFVYRADRNRARGDKSRQKPSKMPESCLPPRPKSVRTEAKVDKNRAKCLNLVYRPDEDSARRFENRPDSVVRTKTTLPEIIKASVHVSIRGTLYPCGGTKKKQ